MPVWLMISFVFVSAGCIYSAAKLFGSGKKAYAKSVLKSYILYTLLFLALWIFKVNIPSYIIFLTMLMVLANCFIGYYHRYYVRSKTFDRFLHAFGAFSFSLMAFLTLNHFISTGSSTLFKALSVFFVGNTLGLIFELAEACHDSKNKVKDQRGLKDTDFDMFCDAIGSALAAVFAYFFIL